MSDLGLLVLDLACEGDAGAFRDQATTCRALMPLASTLGRSVPELVEAVEVYLGKRPPPRRFR